MKVEPVTLSGRRVRLEPLRLEHVEALAEVGLDPSIWRWNPYAVTTLEEMRGYVETALEEQSRGVALPFAILADGKVIGSTRYANIVTAHRRLEIGWTWLNGAYQRTGVNTEAKLLLLTQAFESLGANRVEFKTDVLNDKSRNALVRLGATQEGIFRRHVVTDSGRIRDTIYFSIIREEWPPLKARLEAFLQP